MVPYGTVWSCVVPYGPIWSRMVPYGTVRYHMGSYGTVLYHMVPCDTIWYHMVLYGLLWSLVVVYGPIWSRMVPYGPVCPHILTLVKVSKMMRWISHIIQKFLQVHFPPGHPLSKIINRYTIKISYRCVPNMNSAITGHNYKIQKKQTKRTDFGFNCTACCGPCPLGDSDNRQQRNQQV